MIRSIYKYKLILPRTMLINQKKLNSNIAVYVDDRTALTYHDGILKVSMNPSDLEKFLTDYQIELNSNKMTAISWPIPNSSSRIFSKVKRISPLETTNPVYGYNHKTKVFSYHQRL
jgi:hypothetical protein